MGVLRVIITTFLTVGGLGLPAAAAWLVFSPLPDHAEAFAEGEAVMMRVPVEISNAGLPTRRVYVEIEASPIPEPGVLALVALSGILLMRRRR